ncbi:DUF6089 family protein [Cytophaga aurantiaca]|uniref:DUF6089 family protein n=1 Tax=Cytophaga aurantiaca TaxID=29530 RepID=UPI00038160EC|nr:DUF6089 family protein [Cytophaga aurantiaca]
MRLRNLSVILIVLSLLLSFITNAQTRRIYKGQYHKGKAQPGISLKKISKNELISIFGTIGYATYYGDLCEGIDCFKFRPQIGASALLRTNYLKKRLSLRADVRFFRLYSDDYYKYRNLNFRSSNWEFIASGQFDFFPYEKMMRRRPKINPYIYAGVGLMTYDPWGQMGNGKWHQLRPLETEHTKYGNIAFLYTAGFGLKFRYTYKWSFMVEGGYRYTTTDHIDDVSKAKYDPASSFDNTISAAMSNKSTNFPYNGSDANTPQDYRGNPKNNDGYFIFSAGIVYTFTKNHKPKFHNDKTLLRKN